MLLKTGEHNSLQQPYHRLKPIPFRFIIRQMIITPIAGTDYVATSGVLTFAPGQTTKTFTVSILDDNLNEYPESYYVSLDNAQHVNAAQPMTISNNYSYAYIDDNDPILSINTTAPDTLSESGGLNGSPSTCLHRKPIPCRCNIRLTAILQ